jgi:DNA polymerase III epsilon subunit-like protein
MKNYILTKTKITSGLQCQKKLWFDCHNPIKKDNFLFHLGNRFGAVVRKYYGNGVDLSHNIYDIDLALSDTAKAIKDEKVNVIYEGAFLHSNTLVRADVLLRKNDGWELLEAKSSTKLKDEHVNDIAIQSYIIKSSGVKLNNVKLIHIDNEFIYQGDGNYKNLIEENDLTEAILFSEKLVQAYIEKLKPICDKNSAVPKIEIGEHCKKPYECIYKERCESLLPKSNKTSISILPIEGSKLEKKYKARNINYLEDIPAAELTKDIYRTIQDCHKKNITWVSDEISEVLKKYEFPFYFMDFETINQGVPIIKNTRAYYQLPFQWSVHRWNSIDKEIENKEGKSFIDFDDQNIERKFIESLLENIGDKGTIFAHNATTEKTVLKKIAEKENFKDLSDQINKIILRVVDTLDIVRKNFYSPIFKGDYGLKKVIKAIPSDINYEEDGNIGGGADAQMAWFICTDPKTSKEEKNKQIKLLLEYCTKDTLALYYLIKFLINYKKK